MRPGRMHFRHGARDEPEINLIPFIDVLLVVLIFLMLSTTYSKFTEMQLRLPVADVEAQRDYPKEVIVSVSSDGRYSINKTALPDRSVETVAAGLAAATNGAKDNVIIISADAMSPHQAVITVMEAARRAGLMQITFATQSARAGGALALRTESRLQRAWLRRGPLACLLWPLSLLYGAIAAVRRFFFRLGWLATERVGVPVIVVGNVVAGGAGKTPVVMAVVRHLQARGLRVGVVSRGYGRTTADCREVLATSSARDVGDEPALIHRLTGAPVFVAARRVEAARALLARHPGTEVIVADDGLQHLALARDIEICVFDDRGIGNGWLMPAGPLREHWPRPCDLVLHTGDRPVFEGFTARRALADHAVRSDGTQMPLAALASQTVVALAGIAKPESFFAMLRARGIAPVESIALPDHYDF